MIVVYTHNSYYLRLTTTCSMSLSLKLEIIHKPPTPSYACIAGVIGASGGSGGFLIYASQVGGVSHASGDATTDAVIGGALIFICLVFIGLVALKRKSIEIAISVVEAACECMFAMPSLLIQPACELAVKLVVLSALLYGEYELVRSTSTSTCFRFSL